MSSPHYTPTGEPRGAQTGFARTMRDEFTLIEAGIEEMAQIPLGWHVEDYHKGNNYWEYCAVPFACRVDKIHIVNSAVNGASAAPFWFSTLVGVMAYGVLLPSAPTESIESVDVTENNVLAAGEKITIQMQGDETTFMPIYITFVVSPA